MQRRSLSAMEAVTSTAVGFFVSLALTFTVLPAFGYAVTAPDAWGIDRKSTRLNSSHSV